MESTLDIVFSPHFPVDVHQILNAAKPGDIPIYRPNKFQLLVNLKAAKALSLEMPPTLLARADEVIE
jgi:putative ABC transport system substrate-binding protein